MCKNWSSELSVCLKASRQLERALAVARWGKMLNLSLESLVHNYMQHHLVG